MGNNALEPIIVQGVPSKSEHLIIFFIFDDTLQLVVYCSI